MYYDAALERLKTLHMRIPQVWSICMYTKKMHKILFVKELSQSWDDHNASKA